MDPSDLARRRVDPKFAVGRECAIRGARESPEHLSFYDVNMKYVVEPGDFEIMVGNSSRDVDLQKLILHVKN